MAFKKGQSGNPKGKKPGTPNKATAGLKAAFQKHETALVKALIALTKSKDEHVRLKAVQACFDRGWGKPAQPFTGADAEGPVIVAIRDIIVPAKPNGADPGHPDSGGVRTSHRSGAV